MTIANAATAYKAEMRLVVRALTAAALSLVIADSLALPQSYWAVITALIILQGSLGGTLAAGIDRVLGTLAGAALGVAAALARDFWAVPEVVLLVLAVAPVAMLAAIRPSFRIAPVTAAIVLLANSSRISPLEAALDRVVEIALGTVVGIAVSILILPSRARHICFERCAGVIDLLAQVLGLHLQPPAATKHDHVERLSVRIRAGLGQAATAAQEAHHEHTLRLDEEPVPERLVRVLRRLRMDVVFVGRATASVDFDWRRLTPVLGEVAGSFHAILAAFAGALRQGNPASTPDLAPLDLAKLDGAIAKLRGVIDTGAGDPAASHEASVLPFVIDTLRRDLGDLADALTRPATS